MPELLPRPDEPQTIYVQQYVRWRARLTMAWATIIAAVIGAVTGILVARSQARNEGSRKSVVSLTF